MGKKLTIEIHLNNSAFHNELDEESIDKSVKTHPELDFSAIAKQVNEVAEDLSFGNDSLKIVDYNGNSVGQFFIEEY